MYAWNKTAFRAASDTPLQHAAHIDLTDITTGMIAGTKVATRVGWRPVETVSVGDHVLTFDGGLQEVVAIDHVDVWTDSGEAAYDDWPLVVPAGALGNQAEIMILAEQPVMIESDAAERLYGDPFALIPAASLEDFRGITRVPPGTRYKIVRLHFAQDEIVFANVGALFYCPRKGDIMSNMFAAPVETQYQVRSMDDADLLVACLENDIVDRRVCSFG